MATSRAKSGEPCLGLMSRLNGEKPQSSVAPSQKLGSSPAFTAAAGKLGNGLRPSLYLDFTQVTKLIESFAGANPGFQKAKPYLDTFGAVVAGAKSEGSGVTRSRFVVTLR